MSGLESPARLPGVNPLSRRPPQPRNRLLSAVLRDLQRRGPLYALKKGCSTLARHRQFGRYRFNLRRLLQSADRVKIDRPIFILGVQGGGGTLLARCMQRNPKIVYASGNARNWSGPDEIHNSPHLYDMPNCLVHRSYHFGTVDESVRHHPIFGYQRSWLYAIDELIPESAKEVEDADPDLARRLRQVIARIIQAYADDPEDCRFLDKSQLYTIQAPFLAKLLEDTQPKFVLLARDPYASCQRAVFKEYGAERGGYIADDLQTRIRVAVEHWCNSYRRAHEAGAQLTMLRVKYEDLLDDTEPTLRRICEFCELDYDPRQLPAPGQRFPLCFPEDPKWYPIKRDENSSYLRRLDPRLAQALNERAGDLIETLGYRLIDPRDLPAAD